MPETSGRAESRLVIVTSVYPPQVAGPAVYFSALKNVLEGRGWKVAVLVQPTFFRLLHAVGRGEHVLVHGTPRLLLKLFAVRLLRSFRWVARIGGDFLWERAVERGRFWGTLREFYRQQRFSLRDRALLILLGLALRAADAVVFTSTLLRDLYVPLFHLRGSRVFMITHPFPVAPPVGVFAGRPGGEASHGPPLKRLLYAGRFLKLKNLTLLLEVFRRIRDAYPGLTLELIGEGPEETHLAEVIRTLGLRDVARLRPPLDREGILTELRRSDLFVLPSLSEVSPNALLDAVAVGVPALVTRENGYRDLFAGAVTLFDPMQKADFLEKLRALLAPGALQSARRRLASFSKRRQWDEVAEEYEDVFRNPQL